MLYVITAFDKPGLLELRLATRPKHFTYLEETRRLRLGGPFLNADGAMIGSLMIIEAETLDEAKAWAANDPYAQAGLFAQSEIRPWKVTANACGAAL